MITTSTLQAQFFLECERLSLQPTLDYLIVSISNQELYHYKNDFLMSTYFISSSEKNPSCKENSFGTPWGMHKIAEKQGDDAPLGTVFKGRKSTQQKYWDYPDELQNERLITSRILWLQGLEAGLNQGSGIDSFERFIYIHGTNREHLLGKPVTLGCITLSNKDVITLYDAIPCDSLVWIYINNSFLK